MGLPIPSVNRSLQILLISDHPDAAIQVINALHPTFPHLQVQQVKDENELTAVLTQSGFDLVLLEACLPWTNSLLVMRRVQLHFLGCPIIMIAVGGCESIIQEAIRAGLDGYVPRVSKQLMYLPAAVGLALDQLRMRTMANEACARYRRLFDTTSAGIYHFTPDGKILDVNPACIRILGYPDRETLLAVNIFDLYVDLQEKEYWRAVLDPPNSNHFFETQLYCYDRTLIWVEHTVHQVDNQQDPVSYHEGVLIDITKRKQAELALQESEEYFRTIVEQSPISIQVLTAQGWTIRVNRAWEKLWGLTAADLNNYNILQDEQVINLGMMPYVQRGFAGETILLPPIAYHTPESLKNGRKRWFQARIYPLTGKQNTICNVIVMYEDVTELQWATEDLRLLSLELMNTQETERKHISQELHDELGQALTAMRINFDLLEHELQPDISLAIKDRLTEICTLVDETIEHTRELSHTLRPNMLDELGLVPTLRWFLNLYADRMGIEFEFEVRDLEDRLAPQIETTLYRVIREALTNIARHAKANRVYLNLIRHEDRVSAMIEDDGLGFVVAQHHIPDAVGGKSGMGLFWIRERITLCGGTFTIESQPGQGTRLFMELPLSVRLTSRES